MYAAEDTGYKLNIVATCVIISLFVGNAMDQGGGPAPSPGPPPGPPRRPPSRDETTAGDCALIGDMGPGVVADTSSGKGCAADTVLNTDSNPTCDVMCDTSTHVEQTATVTCAAAESQPTGLPACVSRAECSTITCLGGTSPKAGAAALLCAGAECDNSGDDAALCCD